MSCCGQKRAALAQGHTPVSPSPRRAATESRSARGHTAPAEKADVLLVYLAAGMFSTRGVHTGRVYSCSGSGARLSADRRDAESLLRTRLFRRA